MTTLQMELRLANYFDYRRHIIVPNISWGMHIHECDLFVVSKSGYVTEVEIKISKGDLLNDLKKKHGHKNKMIKKLYFAIPEKLMPYIDSIPDHAGIIVVAEKQIYRDGFKRGVYIFREAIINKDCVGLDDKQIVKVLSLGAMRIWTLKKKIQRMYENRK